VDVQDDRTPAQKAEADALTRREAATANAMEKARLKEEARQAAANAKSAAAQSKLPSTKPRTTPSAPSTNTAGAAGSKSKKKASKKRKNDPEFFTASTVTNKPKPKATPSSRK
jgi:hypothetical protein